ncbi:hypothetical protein, partial [Sebaldella sp. S0638]|uniref:hypothetical protein n=1 Tax=Sebaldella sp. S0638 TaxID=2957809 RepID=UPI00209F5AC4
SQKWCRKEDSGMGRKILIPSRRKEIREMTPEEVEEYINELEKIIHKVIDFKEFLENIERK